jgi:probable HAF family extracellular repeat protein
MAIYSFLARGAAVLFAISWFPAVSGATYTLVDLGAGVAKDINTSGRVVGNSGTGGWLYDGTNRTTLKFQTHFLGTLLDQLLFFTSSTANAINDNGRIVGSIIFIPLQESTRTAYYTDDNVIATLLDDGDGSALNRDGVVVGGSPGFFLTGAALRPAGGATPVLMSINDNALAAGSTVSNGVAVATTFSGTNFTRLSLAGLGLPAGDYESTATAVNNSGRVVGGITLRTGPLPRPRRGFLHNGGTATDLGDLGGAIVSPQDINASNDVVGSATVEDGATHAFVYEGGVISDLNLKVTGAFGWVLVSANAINDRGWIVGEGRKEGVQRAFLLKPVGTAPLIATHPGNARAFKGDSLTLNVSASGTPPLSYQWRHAGTNIPGATATSYMIANAQDDDLGLYSVRVSNDFGSATSNDATLEVDERDDSPLNLSVALYAGVTIPGGVGRTYRIEASEPGVPAWQTVETVTLNVTPYLWVDPTTPGRPGRLYRAVPLP